MFNMQIIKKPIQCKYVLMFTCPLAGYKSLDYFNYQIGHTFFFMLKFIKITASALNSPELKKVKR